MYSTLTAESIKALVDDFYQLAREDPELGPVFQAAIGTNRADWEPHLKKMYAFWGSIMLGTGEYQGNPLQKHRALPPFPEQHFDRWLELFAVSAERILSPEMALLFKEKSKRMGAHLKQGIYRTQ